MWGRKKRQAEEPTMVNLTPALVQASGNLRRARRKMHDARETGEILKAARQIEDAELVLGVLRHAANPSYPRAPRRETDDRY